MKKKQQQLYPADKLVAAKAVKGLSESEIARRTCISEVTIRQVLRGQAKKLDTLVSTAKALGLKIEITIKDAA